MSMQGPLIRHVSDTALWVAAYRAKESERPHPLFVDPHARRLAGERGMETARRVKQPAIRVGVVLRTALLDEAIAAVLSEEACDTVLNLGAGLDARPYRLGLPAGLRWVEVDMPELVGYKDRMLAAESPRCRLERLGLDLADREGRRRLFERLAEGSGGTLVVTEGLLGYLQREEVAALAEDLGEHAANRVWLTDLLGANLVPRVKNAGDELKAGNARVVFAPAEGTAFFEPYGWRETAYLDAFVEAPRLGRDSLAGKALRAVVRLLPAERRKGFERGMGVVRLERGA